MNWAIATGYAFAGFWFFFETRRFYKKRRSRPRAEVLPLDQTNRSPESLRLGQRRTVEAVIRETETEMNTEDDSENAADLAPENPHILGFLLDEPVKPVDPSPEMESTSDQNMMIVEEGLGEDDEQ